MSLWTLNPQIGPLCPPPKKFKKYISKLVYTPHPILESEAPHLFHTPLRCLWHLPSNCIALFKRFTEEKSRLLPRLTRKRVGRGKNN